MPDARGYAASVVVLDVQRCGKQRVEAMQLLSANLGVTKDLVVKQSSWRNHAAARMWRGYDLALLEYTVTVCAVWRRRGMQVRGVEYRDTVAEKAYRVWQHAQHINGHPDRIVYERVRATTARILTASDSELLMIAPEWAPPPTWWGDERVHASHRSALARKRPDIYRSYWPDANPDLPYVWPVAKGMAA